MERPNEPKWISYIKQRIGQNKNFLAILTGPTGSGKSWSALSISAMLDSEFNIDRCVFRGEDLMKLINYGNLRKGSVILWDEAGIDMGTRTWQSLTNRMLNYLLQTFRHKNIILFFTAPYVDFLDSQTRKLFHAEFKTQSIDYNNKKVKIKPQHIVYNANKQKFYHKWLRVMTKEHGTIPFCEWNVPSPPAELIKGYENKKNYFTGQLNMEIERELNEVNQKKLRKKELTNRQEQVLILKKQGKSMKDIAKEMDLNLRSAYSHLEAAKNKGYTAISLENEGFSTTKQHKVAIR